jgi:hypothetical protein
LSTIATNGSTITLTIPIQATFHFTLLTPNDTAITVSGQLVATNSATVKPSIGSIQVQGRQVTLQWQAASGQQFDVESSTDLKSWGTNATGITSGTGAYTWQGSATNGTQFFRLAQ